MPRWQNVDLARNVLRFTTADAGLPNQPLASQDGDQVLASQDGDQPLASQDGGQVLAPQDGGLTASIAAGGLDVASSTPARPDSPPPRQARHSRALPAPSRGLKARIGQDLALAARAARRLARLAVGLAALSPAVAHTGPAVPDQQGFEIEHAALRLAGGVYVADARIDFAFSEDNLEAMRNGVALTVVVDIEVRRERGQWWDETLAARELRFRIETNVLTGRYRVRNLADGTTRNYRSLDEMMASIGRLESVPVIAREHLSGQARHGARIRARLDIEALPSPLRPIAYLSPSWRLNSGWFEWRIER